MGRAMSPEGDRGNCYLQGIWRAEQDGLIAYAPTQVDDYHYSHIGSGDGAPLSLKYTNTRPLSFLAGQILSLYKNEPDIRFLELGPGAGVACAAVSRLLPSAEIDTVSLTPLNPYLRFRQDDVYGHIAEPSSHENCISYFYEPCSPPFVRNQYVGRFPSEIRPRRNDYHFIYDDHGAVFYNFDHGNEAAVELGRASLSSALSLLRPDGTMLVMASDGSCRMEEALESTTPDTDVVVTCKRTSAYHSVPCIVARKESLLAARLRESRDGLLPSSARLLRLETSELESVIAKICAV
jgi:hypothetical protein